MSKLEELLQGVDIEWLPLDDIASFRRGSFPQPYGNSEWYDGEESMPFVQVNDVGFNMKLVEKTKNRISKKAQPKSIFVPENTVIVTLQGSIGRVAITQYDSYVDRTLAIFEEYKKEIDIKYFAYQLEAKFNIEKDRARGNIIKTITKEDFKKFHIPIPPIEIQQEIVRVLDELTSLINQLTTELETERQNRKKQFEFFREQMFSFEKGNVEWKRLGEIFNMKAGKHISSNNISKNPNSEYMFPCFGGNGIRGYVKNNNESGNYVLIGRQGALCGNVKKYNGDFYATEHAVVVKPIYKINIEFAYYLLILMNLNQYASKSAQPGLAVGKLESLKVAIPPLAEQERIVKLLDQLDATHTAIEEEITKEIKLRTQQYEYYREKLLSFPQN